MTKQIHIFTSKTGVVKVTVSTTFICHKNNGILHERTNFCWMSNFN